RHDSPSPIATVINRGLNNGSPGIPSPGSRPLRFRAWPVSDSPPPPCSHPAAYGEAFSIAVMQARGFITATICFTGTHHIKRAPTAYAGCDLERHDNRSRTRILAQPKARKPSDQPSRTEGAHLPRHRIHRDRARLHPARGDLLRARPARAERHEWHRGVALDVTR